MARIRLIIRSLIPWGIFFTLNDYGMLELKISIIAAIVSSVLLNFKSLRKKLIFDCGTLLFFIFLFFSIVLFHLSWFIINVILSANYALTIIIWTSIILKNPITIEYFRVNTAKELWKTTLFYRINNIITIIWGIILTSITILRTVQLFVWEGALWISELLPTILVLLGIWFTLWFPEWYKRNVVGEWGVMNIKNLSNLHIAHAQTASIAYRTLGRGPKLLMIPASNMSMYAWDPELLLKLSKRYQVIIFDYPNVGDSKLKQGSLDTENLSKAIKEFALNLSDEKISILGYGMGGWVSQLIAIENIVPIKELVLIATNVGGHLSTSANIKNTVSFTEIHNTDNKQIEKMRAMFPEEKIHGLLPKMKAIFSTSNFSNDTINSIMQLNSDLIEKWYQGPGTYQRLGDINARTLIITGAQDKIIDRQNSLLLANGIRGAKFVEFSDAGHGIIYQYPSEIANAVIKLTL